MIVKNLLTMVGMIVLCQLLNAQVNAVQYQLRFNESTNLFDAYLLIKDGQATKTNEKIQFNSQFTIIAPENSAFQLIKSYMPLLDNKFNNGTKAQPWAIANVTSRPAADKVHDYISIVPSLTPTGFYNDLNTGDDVKLFSINIQPVTNCGADVKLYENGVSPNSSAKGLKGGDFSNGFTMGGVEQIYEGNAPNIIPAINVIKDIKTVATKANNSIKLDIDENAKYGPYSVEWSGPNNLTAKGMNLDGKLNHLLSGTYTAIVTDNRGCKQIKSIEAKFNSATNQDANVLISDSETSFREKINETIELYPNPANNFINLSIKGQNGTKVVVDITDINGRVVSANVLNTTLSNSNLESNIDIQNITPGVYNLSVSMNDKVTTHKLIIIR
jgi:hypothetical protein